MGNENGSKIFLKEINYKNLGEPFVKKGKEGDSERAMKGQKLEKRGGKVEGRNES